VINVLADKNIFQLEQFVPPEVNLTLYDPNNGMPENMDDYSALLIRTVTKINVQVLPSKTDNLTFIGTASSGTDHVDIPHLNSLGIEFASAAGCNARAVAEYIATSLLLWADSQSVDLTDHKVGIVGVGHVGTEVNSILKNLSVETILYDPPRELRETGFQSDSKEDVLDADILTFHVPLNKTGEYATWHWLDDEKLRGKSYPLIINASRGGVIDEKALSSHFKSDHLNSFILDVWENEPVFSIEMAKNAFIATPHIAGYSYQAKQNATRMICEALCDHFDFDIPKDSGQDQFEKISDLTAENDSLSAILQRLHPIMEYDHSLRSLFDLSNNERAKAFRKLRVDHPFRTEFTHLRVPQNIIAKYPILEKLGIQSY